MIYHGENAAVEVTEIIAIQDLGDDGCHVWLRNGESLTMIATYQDIVNLWVESRVDSKRPSSDYHWWTAGSN